MFLQYLPAAQSGLKMATRTCQWFNNKQSFSVQCSFAHLNLYFLLVSLRYGFFFAALPRRLTSQSRLFTVDVETGVLRVLFNEAASWRYVSQTRNYNVLVILLSCAPGPPTPLSMKSSHSPSPPLTWKCGTLGRRWTVGRTDISQPWRTGHAPTVDQAPCESRTHARRM